MRKLKFFGLTGVLGTFSALVLFAGGAMGQPLASGASTIPAEVNSLLKTACVTCHSNEGRDKPKAKVNFSIWEEYNPTEKSMIAASIADEVKKGSMPPKRFLESHPDAALTESQINQIVQWCETLKPKP